MALKKGVCKNFDNCPLADNKEIQEVDSSDYFCTYGQCRKPLYEITPPPPPKKWKYIIIAAMIFIGGGVGAYFSFFRDAGVSEPLPYIVSLSLNKDALALDVGAYDTLKATVVTTPDGPDANVSVSFTSDNSNVAQVDNAGVVQAVAKGETTITVVAWSPKGTADTAKVVVTVNEIVLPEPKSEAAVQPHQEPNTQGKGKPSDTPSRVSPSKISFGTLDGSLSYDNNATIKVTKQHTMYLKDAKQSTIVVYPGDELRQCRIRNGFLESFQIISKNGNRESILDAHEKLN